MNEAEEQPLSASSGLRRRRLFGLDFVDEPDVSRVVADIFANRDVADRLLPFVVTPNVDYVIQMSNAPTLRRLLESARWCLPDGQPIVWTSRLVGRPLAARLAGSSLVQALWADPNLASEPFAVIASEQLIADSIAESRPNAQVVVAPVLAAHEREVGAFVERNLDAIVATGPSLVFVGIGFPKDVLVVDALRSRWPENIDLPVFLAVGASFEFLFGRRKRAPEWMQRWGLEWLFRFVQEPRRLFVRYFVRGPAFLLLVAREWRRRERDVRRQTRRSSTTIGRDR